MNKQIEIWYLYHSGFAVKIGQKLLIFDYYSNKAANSLPCLYNGVFNPEDFRDLDIFIFVSHIHHDHFNPIIFTWMEQNPNIHIIISSDVEGYRANANLTIAETEMSYVIDDIIIETLTSSDEGIAFLVKTEGVSLFHAGDLHWWHWDGEKETINKQMEYQFKTQIQKLENQHIDIAFLVADPRQEDFALLGLEWFLKKISCSHVFPMHFSDNYSIMERIDKISSSNQRSFIMHLISRRGQHFLF